tara:strand:- start:17911 stop:18468 length:558 start_codon:yes stop_codon:yes gene_type:complete
MKMDPKTIQRAQRIKLLISDVDGVLTDGSVYIGNDGIEYKQFNVLDGAAVAFARESGLKLAVISGRYSPATTSRMKELGINDCYQGELQKLRAYNKIIHKYNLDHDEVGYIGDDLIDASVMEKVGLSIGVGNAHPYIKEIAHVSTIKLGGEGAFREAVEMILKAKGIYEETIENIQERLESFNEK